MALLFMDGCDGYTTEASLGRRYINRYSAIPGATKGRFGAGGIEFGPSANSRMQRSIPPQSDVIICGFAFKLNALPVQAAGENVVSLQGGGRDLLGLFIPQGAQRFVAYLSTNTGGAYAVLGETAELALYSVWNYLEFRCKRSSTVGEIDVYLNGSSILSLSGIATLNSVHTGDVNGVRFASANKSGAMFNIDDIYIANGEGSVNNAPLGDVRIVTLTPNGAGDSTQFTPSAGANYECVDEASPDDDTSYVQSDTVGHKDLYTLSDLPFTPAQIHAAQVSAWVRKDDAGAREARIISKAGATTRNGTTTTPGTSYGEWIDLMEVNPDDSAAWETADIDSLQVGIEIVS